MTSIELTTILLKLDGVLSLLEDTYPVLAELATQVEVVEDASSDSL